MARRTRRSPKGARRRLNTSVVSSPAVRSLEFLARDPPFAQRRPLVAARPLRRRRLAPQIEVARPERFQRNAVIAVIRDLDPVEIEASAIDRQIGAPVAGIARQRTSDWPGLTVSTR